MLKCVLLYIYNGYVVSLQLYLSIQDTHTESSKSNPLFQNTYFINRYIRILL